MSYLAYINGHQLELSDTSIIAYTKQVNDLARLDNRQSNFTHKFTVPFTANNKRAMEFVYSVGNQSNVPYQKNVFDLIDADTGKHLIYKGWANINQSSKKGYEINVYDGIIDFYKAIENLTLTDVDISGLNHAKNLTNIIASWNNTMPYMYAISDYNGKNTYVTPAGTTVDINTDYQVPSARVSYIWDRIFTFAGFTYSGSYFANQKFLNLFMTFPKPVPTLVPITAPITQQQTTITDRWVQQPDFSYIIYFDVHFFPTIINTPYCTSNAIGSLTFLQSGSYRLKCSGIFGCSFNGGPSTQSGIITYTVYTIGQPVNSTNSFSGSINASIDESVIIQINAGQGMFLMAPFYANTGSVITTLDAILGYDADFSAALVDFKVTDFVNEIIQQAGITAFKDKYTNHIEFLTMDEILRSNNIVDWSDKFQYKDIEKYRVGKYAKRNNFTYRYNSENETHNDGYITINDENLEDETDVINSKIYTPERDKTFLVNQYVNVFKIWEKELQDDSTIKYKDLSGRYYFLRFEMVSASVTIASKLLNTSQAITNLAMASYSGLKFSEIINNNYASIGSILDKAKTTDTYFNLKTIDIEKFDFKSLIYIEQLASYYLVNKIPSFIKGKITKCEVIEVDYKKTIPIIIPPGNTATYITIDSFTVVGCVVTLTYSTDATIGTAIDLICSLNNFGLPVFTLPDPIYGHTEVVHNTAVTNTVSFTLEAGAYYVMNMVIQNVGNANINSNQVAFENTAGCIVVSPSSLVITAVTLLSSDGLSQTFKIDFTTDAVLPRNVYVQNYKTPIPMDPANPYAGSFGGWSGYTDNGTATTISINHSVSRIFGDPLKLQIKIGTKESNIYTI